MFIFDLEKLLIKREVKGITVNEVSKRIRLVSFADDIAMFADTAAEMQKILDVLFQYCSFNRLSVNVQNTNVMIFKKRGKTLKIIIFTLTTKRSR